MAKAQYGKPQLSRKQLSLSSANYNFPPGPETNLSRFQYHQVPPITLTEWLRALFEKL